MNFELTEEQRVLQSEARKFTKNEITPVAHQLDEEEKFPKEVFEKAHETGLVNLRIPEEYGGVGLSMVDASIVIEELAAGCMGITTTFMANDLALTPIIVGGSDEQKKRLLTPYAEEPRLASFGLTEPGSGSDAGGMSTTCEKKGDKWVLNGSKQFITNASHASLFTIFATMDKSKKTKGICCFAVPGDSKGLQVVSKEKKMGQRCSDTATIVLEDVEVPEANLLGGAGDGFKVAMKTLDTTRPFIGASAVGMARAALEHATAYAKERKQFGTEIANFQAIQFMLADMAMKVEASRLLTLQAASMIDAGRRASLESSMAKCFSTDATMQVTVDAVQVFGGYGYSREYPVEKIMRDAKLMQIYEGTNQIQRMVISRELLS